MAWPKQRGGQSSSSVVPCSLCCRCSFGVKHSRASLCGGAAFNNNRPSPGCRTGARHVPAGHGGGGIPTTTVVQRGHWCPERRARATAAASMSPLGRLRAQARHRPRRVQLGPANADSLDGRAPSLRPASLCVSPGRCLCVQGCARSFAAAAGVHTCGAVAVAADSAAYLWLPSVPPWPGAAGAAWCAIRGARYPRPFAGPPVAEEQQQRRAQQCPAGASSRGILQRSIMLQLHGSSGRARQMDAPEPERCTRIHARVARQRSLQAGSSALRCALQSWPSQGGRGPRRGREAASGTEACSPCWRARITGSSERRDLTPRARRPTHTRTAHTAQHNDGSLALPPALPRLTRLGAAPGPRAAHPTALRARGNLRQQSAGQQQQPLPRPLPVVQLLRQAGAPLRGVRPAA